MSVRPVSVEHTAAFKPTSPDFTCRGALRLSMWGHGKKQGKCKLFSGLGTYCIQFDSLLRFFCFLSEKLSVNRPRLRFGIAPA